MPSEGPDGDVYLVMVETYAYAPSEAEARERVREAVEDVTFERVTTKAVPLSEFDGAVPDEDPTCLWCDWWRDRDDETEGEAPDD